MHPRPHLRRRQRQRQHGHELVQRHGRRTRTSSGAEITRDKRKLASQTGENDSTLTVYMRPRLPDRVEGRQPDRLRRGPLLPLQRARRAARSAQPSWSPDGVADRLPRRRRRPRSRPCRPSPPSARWRAPRRRPPVRDRRRQRARLGPGRRPRRAPAGHAAAADDAVTPTTQPGRHSLSVSVNGASKRAGVKLAVKVPGKGKLSAVAKAGSRDGRQGLQDRQEGRHRHAQAEGLAQGQAVGEGHLQAASGGTTLADVHDGDRQIKGLTPLGAAGGRGRRGGRSRPPPQAGPLGERRARRRSGRC